MKGTSTSAENKGLSLNQLEKSLGFDQIKLLIIDGCLGEPGRRLAEKIKFNRSFDWVKKKQDLCREIFKLFQEGTPFPERHYFDIQPILEGLEIENYVLMPEQWSILSRTLKTADQLLILARKGKSKFPLLFEMTENLVLPPEIFFNLEQVFDEDGQIKDTASPELNRLRKQKIDEQARLRRRLENALKNAISQGFIADDASLTVRNGRMVIPVLAEYKRRIKGFIHDESATGQTVFLEPEEALESNNLIREIQFAEQREIQRILSQLTAEIRPYRIELHQISQYMAEMDLLRSKARFGLKIQAQFPGYQSTPEFRWYEARHPLLFLSHQKSGKPVVPLSIWLTAEKRVLVISGPNAGGKSICLKTVGLLQYMWQSGLPVCLGEGSTMGHFQRILVDIGDHQSIENDLSTYSSHLANMKQMLTMADSQSLILIDEFGTGTDPALGGPIAEAILESLCHKKVFGLVNTHYSNLKTFASRHAQVENASMKFDRENLEPLFQLEIGQPGSSYALEIAEKIGLPRPVLNQAKNKIGTRKLNVDKLIGELEDEKTNWEKKNTELKIREKTSKKLLDENEKLRSELQNKRKVIVNEARQEARKILELANQKMEEAIRKIKESQAEKTLVKETRAELISLKNQLEPEPLEEIGTEEKTIAGTSPAPQIIEGAIEIGDWVRIKGSENMGQVLQWKGKDAEVLIGDLKTNIKKDRLERMNGPMVQAVKHTRRPTSSINLTQKMMSFKTELDLRGMRTDEAISCVDAWLDEAILLGQKELRILHGKGNGILRTQIRQHLKSYKQVARLSDEHADRGGAGITLVGLNI